MAEKKIKTRIQSKHDKEANWAQATSFIPLAGELIVYDPDNNYSYPRFKFGDGVVVDGKVVGTPVTELPFAHAPHDAEKNVQSDWSVTDTSSDAFIKNKPTIPTVNNATLTIQKNGTTVKTFTANSATNVTANITVPTKTSDLTNDSGFKTTDAVSSVAGKTGAVTLAKGDVGLGNVDNTADANKSVAKATTLTTARTIDGVSFDGSADISHFGTCSTAAGTAAKTVSITGFTLKTGARAIVKFNNTNTATSPTLNINSTGAYPIIYKGASISAYPAFGVGSLEATKTYEFVFTGANYELVGGLHIDRPAGDKLGYAKTGGDITFASGVGTVNNHVRYDAEQTLTDAQKAQAKANLGIEEAVRVFDNVSWTTFNWTQFLGEPTFVKINFESGKGPSLNSIDANGNEVFGGGTRPETLYLNISTEVTSDYRYLWLETVVNGRLYKTNHVVNKETDSIIMYGNTLRPVLDSYSKTEVDAKIKPMIVELEYLDIEGVQIRYQTSKTVEEIHAHVQDGGTVYARYGDDYLYLVRSDPVSACFIYMSDDGFLYNMYIYGSTAYMDENDFLRWNQLDSALESRGVAYKSDLPKAIPTSTIDALFS